MSRESRKKKHHDDQTVDTGGGAAPPPRPPPPSQGRGAGETTEATIATRGAEGTVIDPSELPDVRTDDTLATGQTILPAAPAPAVERTTDSGPRAAGTESLTDMLALGKATEGRRFGEYLLEAELGRGGMGVVFKALHTTLNRPVALKLMLSQEVPEEERRRFLREAESSAQLKHPNIVAVHDVGEESGKLFFSMDFIEGATFKNVLTSRAQDLTLLLRIFVKICDAVGYAHRKGIIHRDLKPQNVMVDPEMDPHVMDFGLARKVHEKATLDEDRPSDARRRKLKLTRLGEVMGTPAYMPPEQAEGKIDEVDTRSDVYALGVILYSILTGDLPYRAETTPELLLKIVDEEPTPPSARCPVPWELERIVMKAIAKAKDDRYPTAHELKEDVEAWLEGRPVRAAGGGPLYRARKFVLRNRAAVAFGVLAIAVAVAAAVQVGRVRRAERLALRDEAAGLLAEAGKWIGDAEAKLLIYKSGRSGPLPADALAVLGGAVSDYDEALKRVSQARGKDPDSAEVKRVETTCDAGKREAAIYIQEENERAGRKEKERLDRLQSEEIVAREKGVLDAIDPSALEDLDAVKTATDVVKASREKLIEARTLNPLSPTKATEQLVRAAGIEEGLAVRTRQLAREKEFKDFVQAADLDVAEGERARAAENREEARARFRKASWALDDALRIFRDDAAALRRRVEVALALGRLALDARRFDEAESLMDNVRSLDPPKIERFQGEISDRRAQERKYLDAFRLAEQERDGERFDEAAKAYRVARNEAPGRPEAEFGLHLSLGAAAAKDGRHEDALALYAEARPFAEPAHGAGTLDRAEARSRAALAERFVREAEAAIKVARYEDAAAAVTRALKYQPDHKRAAELLREIEDRQRAPEGMVLIPGGPFTYGEKENEPCDGFFIGRYEVTNDDFAEFVAARGYEWPEKEFPKGLAEHFRSDFDGLAGPRYWQGQKPPPGKGYHPVAGVSWYEANAYARWEGPGWRLPTDREWMKAATWDAASGKSVPPPWLVPDRDGTVRSTWMSFWGSYFRKGEPQPVRQAVDTDEAGTQVADRSPAGVYGVWGNVREIVDELGPDAAPGAAGGPIVRGGSFSSRIEARSSAYRWFRPERSYREREVGFRLARSAGGR